jgi:hypothetical protein
MTSGRAQRARRTLRPAMVFAVALVAALGAFGTSAAPAARPPVVRAATPDLTIVGAARYDVQPNHQRVRVTVDLTLTNHKSDTRTKRFFFDHAFLAVLPGTNGYHLSWQGSGVPNVVVARRAATHTLLRLNFAQDLSSGKSASYRLTFDLKDPGGKSTRELRIGNALVSFPVWAFASDDTPGSTVTVIFPKGYDIKVEAGTLPAPQKLRDGRVVYRSGTLSRPLDFFAYLVGERPGAYKDTGVTANVRGQPVDVTVRAWPDDRSWAARIEGLLRRALPPLGDRIGLPWPELAQPLVVQEAISRSTGGYAGIFDPNAGRIDIAYYADDFVVLHEAAHAWFNGSLLADRWSNEGFASYYASLAAADAKVKVTADRLSDQLQKSRIPLNAWGAVGTTDPTKEEYAYAAALTLARQIADRAGVDGLQEVWADVSDRISAYQPAAGGEEVVGGPVDWRGLLDLLEARTHKTYDDLWRRWVARPEDLPLLDARTTARKTYETFLGTVGDWHVPLSIRDAMRSWRFDDATSLMDGAGKVVTLRGQVDAAAQAAGLTPPDSLRQAFEDDDGFDDALAEGGAELQTIERYVAAVAKRPAEVTPLMTLGLLNESPETDLVAARDAFAQGDLAASAEASDEAAASWLNAETIGQGRAFSIGTIVVAILFVLTFLLVSMKRRRRRRVRMQATRIRT